MLRVIVGLLTLTVLVTPRLDAQTQTDALLYTQTNRPQQHFLRINTPTEQDRYSTTSNVEVQGSILLSDHKGMAKSLYVRVRLYYPVDGRFVVVKEELADVQAKANDKRCYVYYANLDTEEPYKVGRYLLRVDCLDKTQEGWPIVASQSVFHDRGAESIGDTRQPSSNPRQQGESHGALKRPLDGKSFFRGRRLPSQ